MKIVAWQLKLDIHHIIVPSPRSFAVHYFKINIAAITGIVQKLKKPTRAVVVVQHKSFKDNTSILRTAS